MDYAYSPSQNMFFPASDKENYVLAGTWPDDASPIEYKFYQEFVENEPPAGMVRTANANGMPAWAERVITQGQMIANAELMRSDLISAATLAMAPLHDAVELDIATDDEIARLKAWKTYRVLLNRVDVSNAPEINWPTPPLL